MLPHFPPIFSRAHQLSLSPALFEEEDEDEDSAERKLHVNVALQVVLPAPPPSQQCLRRFRVKSRLGSRKSDFKQSDRAAAACAGSSTAARLSLLETCHLIHGMRCWSVLPRGGAAATKTPRSRAPSTHDHQSPSGPRDGTEDGARLVSGRLRGP